MGVGKKQTWFGQLGNMALRRRVWAPNRCGSWLSLAEPRAAQPSRKLEVGSIVRGGVGAGKAMVGGRARVESTTPLTCSICVPRVWAKGISETLPVLAPVDVFRGLGRGVCACERDGMRICKRREQEHTAQGPGTTRRPASGRTRTGPIVDHSGPIGMQGPL
eukprot:2486785-Prymnesium_polylepis.2